MAHELNSRCSEYGFTVQLNLSYEETVEKVKNYLSLEGFGILWEIDLKQKLKEEIGTDFRKYVILGACHPELAHRALTVNPDTGLVLPCNVIVYEDDSQSTTVGATDPERSLDCVHNPKMRLIAKEASERLRRVLTRIAA